MGEWPVELRGVTESIVTTQGPNGRWNVAALGLHVDSDEDTVGNASTGEADEDGVDRDAADEDGVDRDAADEDGVDRDAADESGTRDGGSRVRARTWGRTRTRRNFRERGGGFVQFTRDPVDFVEAALAVREEDDPLLGGVDAWARVDATRLDAGESDGTEWIDWELTPRESAVETRVVPTTNRGYAAVIEATVAASRLDVESYETERLRERLGYFADVAVRCGGPRERAAMERVRELVEW